MPGSDSRPLITAIIPTYRRPKLLRRAIRSALNQTYPHVQVSVYDNASGDETGVVADEFIRTDGRLNYHCHPTNIGALNNFMYGMAHVETPFFSMFSDDDFLLPDFYQHAMDMFDRYPDAIFFAGETIRLDEKGRVLAALLASWPREGYFVPRESLPLILGVRHPTWTAIVFRREVLEQVGRLDPAVNAPADLDFIFRAAARFPILISKKPCAIFIHHSSSAYESARMNAIWPGWLKMVRNLRDDDRIPEDLRSQSEFLLAKLLRLTLLVQAVRCLRRNDLEEAHKAATLLDDNDQVRKKSLAFASLIRLLIRVRPLRHLFFRLTELLIDWSNFYYSRTRGFGEKVKLLSFEDTERHAADAGPR